MPYAHMHANAAQAPRLAFPWLPLAPHLSPQVSVSHTQHVCVTGPARPLPHQFVCLLELTGGEQGRGCKKLAQVKSD